MSNFSFLCKIRFINLNKQQGPTDVVYVVKIDERYFILTVLIMLRQLLQTQINAKQYLIKFKDFNFSRKVNVEYNQVILLNFH